MTNKDQKCAYCHAILFEDDDVVYCPECGAPHHRDCYAKLGECANKANHDLEPEQAEEPAQEQPQQEEAKRPEGIPFDRDGHTCARCGKISTSDTLFCPYCGTPFVQAGQQRQPFNAYTNIQGVDPYGGVNPNEVIDGHTVSEIASHVRVNTPYYIAAFKKSADLNTKVSWNWASFLLTYVWLFFRKCYREGFVVVLFSLLVSVMQAPWTLSFYAYLSQNGLTLEDLMAKSSDAAAHAYALGQSIPIFAWIMFAVGFALSIGIHITVGMLGNHLYRKRATKKIKQIKEDINIVDKATAIAVAGGCNIFSAVAIYYAVDLVVSLIYTLL